MYNASIFFANSNVMLDASEVLFFAAVGFATECIFLHVQWVKEAGCRWMYKLENGSIIHLAGLITY